MADKLDKSTKYTTIRVLRKTAKSLKLLAAVRDESMLSLLDRLVLEELRKAGINATK